MPAAAQTQSTANGWFHQSVSESIINDDAFARNFLEFKSVLPNAATYTETHKVEDLLESKGVVWYEVRSIVRPQTLASPHAEVSAKADVPKLHVMHKYNKHYTALSKFTSTEMMKREMMSRRTEAELEGIFEAAEADGMDELMNNAGRIFVIPTDGTGNKKMSFEIISMAASKFWESGRRGGKTCFLCDRHVSELTSQEITLNAPKAVAEVWENGRSSESYLGTVAGVKIFRMPSIIRTPASDSGTLNSTIDLRRSVRVKPVSVDDNGHNVDYRLLAKGKCAAAATSPNSIAPGEWFTVANFNRVNQLTKRVIPQPFQMRILKNKETAIDSFAVIPPPLQYFDTGTADTVATPSYHWANCKYTGSTPLNAASTMVKIELREEIASLMLCDNAWALMSLTQPVTPEGVLLASGSSFTRNKINFMQSMSWLFGSRSCEKRFDACMQVLAADPDGIMAIGVKNAYS